ncbi:MAG: tetratricopeptide repeat protein [Acidobacteria bacterium]|nr:tetratricopeptide repeat protein [Acidobacteriota bacterium]
MPSGHAYGSFPPEVRDLYEAWVEFQALDASGKKVFHSGYLKPDGMLDESAHVYKQIILDERGRQITRHQIWTTNIKAYDNTINAGRSDVVRFRFKVPELNNMLARRMNGGAKFSRQFIKTAARNPQPAVTLTLRTRVNYRRLNQEYINYVLTRQKKPLKIPVVQMAEAELKLSTRSVCNCVYGRQGVGQVSNLPTALASTHSRGDHGAGWKPAPHHLLPNLPYTGQVGNLPPTPPVAKFAVYAIANRSNGLSPVFSANKVENRTPEWKRWNDYGIGLLEQAQYGPAAAAFRRSGELSPNDPDLLVNAAIAEMRTERFAHHERPQLQKAAELIERALQIPPDAIRDPRALWRARYHRALVWRAQDKRREAAEELKQIAAAYPRDREIQRQLAQTLYASGQLASARTAFETILKLDPTDAGAYQFLSPLYLSAGL